MLSWIKRSGGACQLCWHLEEHRSSSACRTSCLCICLGVKNGLSEHSIHRVVLAAGIQDDEEEVVAEVAPTGGIPPEEVAWWHADPDSDLPAPHTSGVRCLFWLHVPPIPEENDRLPIGLCSAAT